MPSILSAREQTYGGTVNLYYVSTTFELHGYNAACTWLNSIPTRCAALAKIVKITLHELDLLLSDSDDDAKFVYSRQFAEAASEKGADLELIEMDIDRWDGESLWDDAFPPVW
jgi:hypothetical protein